MRNQVTTFVTQVLLVLIKGTALRTDSVQSVTWPLAPAALLPPSARPVHARPSTMTGTQVPTILMTHTSNLTLKVEKDDAKSFGMSINANNRVCNLAPNGMAAAAGLLIGDLVMTFNGVEVSSEAGLFAAMNAAANGAECVFTVSRKGD